MIRLFELRSEKRLSQREIAKIFNVSQGTYNNWENARTQPSLEQLIALADFFDVSVDYLIGKEDFYSGSDSSIRLNDKQKRLLALFDEHDEVYQESLLNLLDNQK